MHMLDPCSLKNIEKPRRSSDLSKGMQVKTRTDFLWPIFTIFRSFLDVNITFEQILGYKLQGM